MPNAMPNSHYFKVFNSRTDCYKTQEYWGKGELLQCINFIPEQNALSTFQPLSNLNSDYDLRWRKKGDKERLSVQGKNGTKYCLVFFSVH